MAERPYFVEAASLDQFLGEVSAKLKKLEEELFPKLEKSDEELSGKLEELDITPTHNGVLPDWDYPYEYPKGRMDCYLLTYKKDRIEHITPCAEKVLESFNSQHGTDYKLVDCLDICLSRESQFFVHCNFTAQPNSAPLNAGDFDPKVFFAEIDLDPNDDIFPTTYQMFDGVNAKLGCDMCPDVIAHPTSGPDEGLILIKFSPHFIRGDF